ncbi:UNVERIFIED_CONTAM: hypothetical protein Slati_0344700 [Sesamum latifolium]|uniref:Uncharacterized protein n=1 Tax=Sesamum latifolium TaxID=2727402 RepID=A0AAW2YFP5_9LAMI
MGLEMDIGKRLEAKMEASAYKGTGIFAKELEDELMKFTMKSEDNKVDAHLIEKTEEVQRNTEEVNITDCTKSLGNELVEAAYQDTTESSSSFDDSDSGVENIDTLGDSEASSDFHGDTASALDFDGSGEKFRMRKPVAVDWQRVGKRCLEEPKDFSGCIPLKHCLVEVKGLVGFVLVDYVFTLQLGQVVIRGPPPKLQSQAQQYDRELEAYNKQKQIQLENSMLVDGVKSLPFSQTNARSDILKRKKRRTTEATMDVAAYMSHHNLFSYYGRNVLSFAIKFCLGSSVKPDTWCFAENRKSFTEGAFMSNELKNPATRKVDIEDEFWINDELLSIAPGDGDNSLEHILGKIDYLQSQVGKLKSRVDKVMHENAGKLSCMEDLTLPMACNASPPNSGDRMAVGTYIASQLISEYSMGNALVPESAVTSQGDVVPDANGSKDHACFPDAHENSHCHLQSHCHVDSHIQEMKMGHLMKMEFFIDNERVKEEMNSFEEVKIQPIQTPLVLKDGSGNTTPPAQGEPDLPTDDNHLPKFVLSQSLLPRKARGREGEEKLLGGGGEVRFLIAGCRLSLMRKARK